jgi:predicted DNA-binding WGR domain protein
MIVLIRVDPEKRMARWYAVTVQPTLLDGCVVVCLWGSRRTRYQRIHIIPTDSSEEALGLAEKITAKKIRRGYRRLNK